MRFRTLQIILRCEEIRFGSSVLPGNTKQPYEISKNVFPHKVVPNLDFKISQSNAQFFFLQLHYTKNPTCFDTCRIITRVHIHKRVVYKTLCNIIQNR